AYRYNLRAARRLLARAGFRRRGDGVLARGGAPLSINLWGDAACRTCTAPLRAIAQGWSAAGVASHLRLGPTTALVGPRGPLYRRIQRLLVADEPDIFLYWADAISVVPRGLRGYDPTPYDSAVTWNARAWSVTK